MVRFVEAICVVRQGGKFTLFVEVRYLTCSLFVSNAKKKPLVASQQLEDHQMILFAVVMIHILNTLLSRKT